jgi:hypothetical protein
LQPYDFAVGMNMGLGFYLPNNRYRICLRNDFTFNYGEQTTVDNNENVVILEKNGIYNYHTYNYLDFDYKISTKRNLYVDAAPGWVFAGGNQNYKFDESAGYYVLSLSAKIQYSWLVIEVRGDIPLSKVPKTVYSGQNGMITEQSELVFPLSVSLSYPFCPQR